MSPALCKVCNAPLDPQFIVCRFCGAPSVSGDSIEWERQMLSEAHKALAHALGQIPAGDGRKAAEIRNRFLQNVLVPSYAELAVDEALYLQQQFDEVYTSEAVVHRYQACLARIDLLALETPSLKPKAEQLRQELQRFESKSRAAGVFGVTMFLVAAAIMVGSLAWLITRVLR